MAISPAGCHVRQRRKKRRIENHGLIAGLAADSQVAGNDGKRRSSGRRPSRPFHSVTGIGSSSLLFNYGIN